MKHEISVISSSEKTLLLSVFKNLYQVSLFSFLSMVHQKKGERNGIFWSDLSLKNRISPLRVLIASKDKVGSHAAGVSGPEGTDSVGATGSSGETGGGPEGNRCGEANRRTTVMLSSMYVLSKHTQGTLKGIANASCSILKFSRRPSLQSYA